MQILAPAKMSDWDIDKVRKEWSDMAALGWNHAGHGRFAEALECYETADDIASIGKPVWGDAAMNPRLNLLRHAVGSSPGYVQIPGPTEDVVIGASFDHYTKESDSNEGMTAPTLDFDFSEYSYDAGFHLDNIKEELPHLQVLSTGRCGTVSLYKLLARTQYIPYHSYYFTVSPIDRFEMLARHMAKNYEHSNLSWVMTRAAEWIGAINLGRPMAAMVHTDTVFAPTFAQIHPKSKFIYLHRDPEKIFASFYNKAQWNLSQIAPLYYAFDPDFRFRLQYHGTDDIAPEFTPENMAKVLAWYIRFTEKFALAFGSTLGDRFTMLSADNLFNQDEDEIQKLIDFTEIDLPKSEVMDHFAHKYNEKAHKIKNDSSEGLDVFRGTYDSL